MSNQNKQVQTKQKSAVPAYMQNVDDLGVDVIENNDVVTPRVKICQPMTTTKETLTALKDGEYFTTGVERVLGKSIQFFILTKFNSRVWFKGGKMVGYYSKNPRTGNEVSYGDEINNIMDNQELYEEGSDSFNYVIVLANELEACLQAGTAPTMYVYSASGAARKNAKKLNSLVKANAQRKVPIYATKIEASSVLESFDGGKAWMPEFSEAGFASEDEFQALKGGYEIARAEQDKGAIHKEEEEATASDSGNELNPDDPFSV